MGYVPADARWYLAEIIVEHKIEEDPHNVVHTNTVLIRASSPERAYNRALKLGQKYEQRYQNTDDKTVETTFRGLGSLLVIYDSLRSGAELIFHEQFGLTNEQVAAMVLPKAELEVFEEWSPPSREKPNYMPQNVAEKLNEAGFNEDDLYR